MQRHKRQSEWRYNATAISMGRRKLIRACALATWLAQNEPGGLNAMIPSCGIEAIDASKGKHDA